MPETWGEPDAATVQVTDRYGTARAMAWDRIHPRLTTRSAWIDHTGDLPIIEGTLIRLQVDRLPGGIDPLPVWLWSSATGLTGEGVDVRWQAFLRRSVAITLRPASPAVHPCRDRQHRPCHGPLRIRHVRRVARPAARFVGRVSELVSKTVTPRGEQAGIHQNDHVQLRQQGLLVLGLRQPRALPEALPSCSANRELTRSGPRSNLRAVCLSVRREVRDRRGHRYVARSPRAPP